MRTRAIPALLAGLVVLAACGGARTPTGRSARRSTPAAVLRATTRSARTTGGVVQPTGAAADMAIPSARGRRRRLDPCRRTGPIRPRTTCSSTAATPRSSPPPTTPNRRSRSTSTPVRSTVGQAQLDERHPARSGVDPRRGVGQRVRLRTTRRRPTATRSASIVETGDAPHADDGTQLVRVGITTTELPTRAPAGEHHVRHRHVGLDGHPRPARPRQVVAGAARAARCDADDTIAIVTYGDEARAGAGADAGRRGRAHRRRHRRARPGRQHEHGGRAAARLRAGPRGVPARRRSTPSCWRPTASPTSASPTRPCSPSRSRRPARRASTSSPSATAWATTTTT